MITHIETYNLKNAAHGMTLSTSEEPDELAGEAVSLKSPEQYYRLISDLQQALTEQRGDARGEGAGEGGQEIAENSGHHLGLRGTASPIEKTAGTVARTATSLRKA